MYKGTFLIDGNWSSSQVTFYKKCVVEKSCLLKGKREWKFNTFNTDFE